MKHLELTLTVCLHSPSPFVILNRKTYMCFASLCLTVLSSGRDASQALDLCFSSLRKRVTQPNHIVLSRSSTEGLRKLGSLCRW